MRSTKFMVFIFLVTIFALLYVWQQTEVFRLGYVCQKNLTLYQDLLDKNIFLRYNIKRNTSLVRLGNKITEDGFFEMPDTFRLVKLTNPKDELRLTKRLPKIGSMAFNFFSVKRRAEAKTINSPNYVSSTNSAKINSR